MRLVDRIAAQVARAASETLSSEAVELANSAAVHSTSPRCLAAGRSF